MKVYDEGVSCYLNTDMPLPKKGERFDAAYVRVYMNGSVNGNTVGKTNHIVELEVFGKP